MNILPKNLTKIAVIPVNTELHAQTIAWYSPFCEVCKGYAPANLAVFVGYNPGSDQIARLYKHNGIPTLCWWIGSDIMFYDQASIKPESAKTLYDYHMCPSEENKAELAKHGIDATVQSVVPAWTYPYQDIATDKKRVMMYFPVGRYDEVHTWKEIYNLVGGNLYCLQECMEMVEACPEVEFYIYANGCEVTDAPKNANILGRVDQNLMHNVYARCNILLRKTMHEGISQSVIEAKQSGLQVITNKKTPHINYASTKDEFIKVLNELELKPDPEGSAYYQTEFHPDRVLEKWAKLINPEIGRKVQADSSTYYRETSGSLI